MPTKLEKFFAYCLARISALSGIFTLIPQTEDALRGVEITTHLTPWRSIIELNCIVCVLIEKTTI